MNHCLYCGDEFTRQAEGRKRKFCSLRCKIAHHRREFRYKKLRESVTKLSLEGVVILELFPGAGLFGRAFESLGACVVRGPDILWGGDVRSFKGTPGRFDGVIGGPPCQIFSQATAIAGTKAIDLIPEYLRIVQECQPAFAVMENVMNARNSDSAPDWDYTIVRDWDAGGRTYRRRCFWFYNLPAPPAPEPCPGTPEYSVLATSWKNRNSDYPGAMHILSNVHYSKAAELQGYPDLGERIATAQPMEVPNRARNILAVHMLGNGVPAAMGRYVAEYVAYALAAKALNSEAV